MSIGSKTELFVRQQAGGMFTVVNEAMTTGNIFWVDSGKTTTGRNTSGFGKNPDAPFLTLDFAIGQCTASNGDRVFVMPGHAETIAAAESVDVDVAGVTIIGMGNGADRPTFTMSDTTSIFILGAASCHIENLLLLATDDVVIMIDINAADCTVENCELRYGSSKEWETGIDIDGGGANVCDRTVISNCLLQSVVAGANNGILLNEVADSVIIKGCNIWGDFADAAIHNPTGSILTNLLIRDCFLQNTQTTDLALELISDCTGMLINNTYYADAASPAGIDPGNCFSVESYQADAVDTSGLLAPVAT